MSTGGELVAESSFGPAEIFTALMQEGVSFSFVGFITHYADQLYHQQHPVSPVDEGNRPQSPVENRNRLARALQKLGAARELENRAPELFTGDGSELTIGHHLFRTKYGDIRVSMTTLAVDQAAPGRDAISGELRINITIPTSRLRSYAATGKFPGIAYILEIIELFDEAVAGPDHSPAGTHDTNRFREE